LMTAAQEQALQGMKSTREYVPSCCKHQQHVYTRLLHLRHRAAAGQRWHVVAVRINTSTWPKCPVFICGAHVVNITCVAQQELVSSALPHTQ
jgi:hypothetical protein